MENIYTTSVTEETKEKINKEKHVDGKNKAFLCNSLRGQV